MSPISPAPVPPRRLKGGPWWLVCLISIAFAAAGMFAHAGSPVERDALWRDIFSRQEPAPLATASPKTALEAELGARLFSDPRLSGSGKRSCSSCHRPEHGFTDGLPRAAGIDGKPLDRNTPHLFNLAWAKNLFWDGRAKSLEEQAVQPITAANELNGNFETIVTRLSRDAAMVAAFAEAFGGSQSVNQDHIQKAIAAYQRSIVSQATRFDAWVSGDDSALTDQEKLGFDIFVGKGGCVACHGGWRFTDDQLHDTGMSLADGQAAQRTAFKTPGLRELSRTAPYMHDGSLSTLEQVIDHYAGGLTQRASLSPNIVRDLKLTKDEKQALAAFLESLSSGSSD